MKESFKKISKKAVDLVADLVFNKADEVAEKFAGLPPKKQVMVTTAIFMGLFTAHHALKQRKD